jgi:PilZ domain
MGFGIISRLVKKERRSFPRFPVHFDVMYGRGEDFTLSTAVDLSEGGLSFLSSRIIPEGSRLRVRLMMQPGNQEDCIEVESTVIRNEEKLTVVNFAGLTRSERQKILKYLSQPVTV